MNIIPLKVNNQKNKVMDNFIKTMVFIIIALIVIGICSDDFGVIAIFLIAPTLSVLLLALCVPQKNTEQNETPKPQKQPWS